MEEEGKSLAETPTWAVATVVTLLVAIGFLLHGGLNKSAKWLDSTKRKNILAALEKIKEELMVFGVLSLLMGHWIKYVAEICVKSSAMSSRFYPCVPPNDPRHPDFRSYADISISNQSSSLIPRVLWEEHHEVCPKDHQSFVSRESLEQLHRFLFVLGVTHVSYSVLAIVLAMIKIFSWRTWENDAKTMAVRGLLNAETSTDSEAGAQTGIPFRRLLRFMVNHVSHPWSQHRILVWLLCFSRQFWSSINHADYMALRLGFITTHQLPFTYDFHNYMIRSMEEEFRDIVGISIPLWIFAICSIILGFHGTNIYFWLSFLPVILVLVVGTKLHHVVVKLAVEIMESSQWNGLHQFNLRDELFWFGSPMFLLRVIQFISFQNAFEMALYVWSQWEVNDPSCFTKDRRFIVIRLTSGIVSQFWCSFVTFPLYVIVTQMGSKFKKTIVSENVRESLHGWRTKVKARHGPASPLLPKNTSVDSMVDLEEQTTSKTTTMEESSIPSQGHDMLDENGSTRHNQDSDTIQGEAQLRDLMNWPRESHHEQIERQGD